jgi:hypothetical protein
VTLEVYLKKTPEYYSGFQRISLFSDPILQKCALVFAGTAVITVAAVFFIPGEQARETVYILTSLLFTLPMALLLVGGMSAVGWLWYGGFCAFSAAGTVPPYLGYSHSFIYFLAAAAICLFFTAKNNPSLLKSFGYSEHVPPVREILPTAISSFLFIFFAYYVLTEMKNAHFRLMAFSEYVLYAADFTITYGVFFGLLYGVLLRHLMKKHFDLHLLIGINIFLLYLTWLPVMIHRPLPAMIAVGSFAFCFFTQTVLGLTFFFCRSTRIVFFAYLFYYLFSKSAIF